MTLEQCCKKLLIKEPFYGLFLLGLNKYYGDKCQTACVCRKGINVELCINKEFWDEQTDEMQLSIIKHEVGHILFKHLTMMEYFGDKEHFNISSDCEVNSYIPNLQKDPFCYASRFNLKNGQGTKYYYENIPKQENSDQEQSQFSNDQSNVGSHEQWKDFQNISNAEKQLIENQIDYQAKSAAEQCQKIAGSIPGELKSYLDSLFEHKPQVFNWKAYFRRVIGNLITSELYLTRMRPSRRFPTGRGVKFKRKPTILVGVDTSGSVPDSDLCDFFSEIHHIWKTGVDVTVAQVDTKIEHIDKYDGKFNREIYGRGGTEFSSLITFYNEHRSEFSSIVIFTDGYVSLDLPPFLNSVWVITKGGCEQDYPGTTIYIP